MNEVKIFNSEEFGDIRTVQLNNEAYFVGKDVATALGYADTFGALKKHIMDEDKLVCQIDSAGQKRRRTVMSDGKIHIPARRKQPVDDQMVVKVTSEAYNALVEIYNESTLSLKQIASLLIVKAAEQVVYDKE